MRLFKKLFALPRSSGLKVIALMMYSLITLLILGAIVNLFRGGS